MLKLVIYIHEDWAEAMLKLVIYIHEDWAEAMLKLVIYCVVFDCIVVLTKSIGIIGLKA